jgi:hypothetical protein
MSNYVLKKIKGKKKINNIGEIILIENNDSKEEIEKIKNINSKEGKTNIIKLTSVDATKNKQNIENNFKNELNIIQLNETNSDSKKEKSNQNEILNLIEEQSERSKVNEQNKINQQSEKIIKSNEISPTKEQNNNFIQPINYISSNKNLILNNVCIIDTNEYDINICNEIQKEKSLYLFNNTDSLIKVNVYNEVNSYNKIGTFLLSKYTIISLIYNFYYLFTPCIIYLNKLTSIYTKNEDIKHINIYNNKIISSINNETCVNNVFQIPSNKYFSQKINKIYNNFISDNEYIYKYDNKNALITQNHDDFCSNNKYIFLLDIDNIYIHDIQTYKLIKTIPYKETSEGKKIKCNNSFLFILKENIIIQIDLSSFEEINTERINFTITIENFVVNEHALLLQSQNKISILNLNDNTWETIFHPNINTFNCNSTNTVIYITNNNILNVYIKSSLSQSQNKFNNIYELYEEIIHTDNFTNILEISSTDKFGLISDSKYIYYLG